MRLVLICHAATSATRRAAFPTDEPLEPQGQARAAALGRTLRRPDHAWTSPALRARQTAAALDLTAEPLAALRDLDCGDWAGRTLEEVETDAPADAAAWLSDPAARSHGGESIRDLRMRVANWLDALTGEHRVTAVTHAAVMRVALIHVLAAPTAAFWHIDIPPLARLALSGRAGRWTLRGLTHEKS